MCADDVWPWSELDLPGQPEDPRDVRRAYARLMKSRDWSGDVAGFERLRMAYDQALRLVGEGKTRHRIIDNVAPKRAHPAEVTPPLPPMALPPAAPASPWHRDPADLLWERLDRHVAVAVESGRADSAELRAILGLPALDDPWLRAQVEATLLRQIMEGSFPETCIRIADDRFGWRQDGVGFMRRFPWAAQAYNKVLALPSASAITAEKAGGSGGRSDMLKTVLVGLAFMGFVRVLRSAESGTLDGNVVETSLAALAVGAIALIVLLALQLALKQAVFPALRWSLSMHDWLYRMLSWWSRPLLGVSKTVATYSVVILLAIPALTPPMLTHDVWRLPWLSTVNADHLALYGPMSMWDSGAGVGPLDPERAAIPSFVLSEPVQDKLSISLNSSGEFQRAMSGEAEPRDRVLATLRCRETSRCELAMRHDVRALRLISTGMGFQPTSTLLEHVMKFEVVKPDRVHVTWSNKEISRSDAIALARPRTSATEPNLVLHMRMFEAFATFGKAGEVTLEGRSELPTAVLEQPVAMRFDWPPRIEDAASCGYGSTPMPLANCRLHPDRLQGETLICPPGDATLFCRHSRSILSPVDNSMVPWDGPSITSEAGSHGQLMQELLRRLAIGGSHPALPDSETLRALHRQVLQDYALILRHTAEPGDRSQRQALRATLARQPQLFQAMRADPKLQEVIWERFLKHLIDLGFPETPALMGPDRT